jgi:hypothetical protein
MAADTVEWKVDEESLLRDLGLSPEDRRLVRGRTRDLVEALAQAEPRATREAPTAPASGTFAPGAPLYIPALKLHLNLTATTRQTLISAVGIVVKMMVMGELGLAALAQPLTTAVLTNLIGQFTRLSDEQRRVLDAMLQVKKQKGLPGYAPTSKDIAAHLKSTAAAVDKVLKPLAGKVVRQDAAAKTWSLIL